MKMMMPDLDSRSAAAVGESASPLLEVDAPKLEAVRLLRVVAGGPDGFQVTSGAIELPFAQGRRLEIGGDFARHNQKKLEATQEVVIRHLSKPEGDSGAKN